MEPMHFSERTSENEIYRSGKIPMLCPLHGFTSVEHVTAIVKQKLWFEKVVEVVGYCACGMEIRKPAPDPATKEYNLFSMALIYMNKNGKVKREILT